MSSRSALESVMMAVLMLAVGWFWRGNYAALDSAVYHIAQLESAVQINAKTGEILSSVASNQRKLLTELRDNDKAINDLDYCKLPNDLAELLDAQTKASRSVADAARGVGVPDAVRD